MATTKTATVATVRLSRPVRTFLEGSGPYQGQQYSKDKAAEAAARSLVEKMKAAKTRKDGSVAVRIETDEAAVLYDYASTLHETAGNNLGGDQESRLDALAEWNASNALCVRLQSTFGRKVVR